MACSNCCSSSVSSATVHAPARKGPDKIFTAIYTVNLRGARHPMSEFNLTRLEKVISGPGSVDAVGAELDVRGVTRAVIVTGTSLGRSHLLARVQDALGARCVGVSSEAAEHAPAGGVRAVAKLLSELQADAIVKI